MIKKATFSAGCFWGIEEKFFKSGLVLNSKVGYTGGHLANPTYEQVCNGTTGHAESVQVEYNSDKTHYSELLNVFWNSHDPTTPNAQGPDIGSQYRSCIFYHDDSQKSTALKNLQNIQSKYKSHIVTEITPASQFYPAESYHQKHFNM